MNDPISIAMIEGQRVAMIRIFAANCANAVRAEVAKRRALAQADYALARYRDLTTRQNGR